MKVDNEVTAVRQWIAIIDNAVGFCPARVQEHVHQPRSFSTNTEPANLASLPAQDQKRKRKNCKTKMRVTRENGVRDNKKAVQNGSKISSGAFGAGSSLSFQAIKCKHFCQEKAEKPESSINATNQQKMQNGPKYKKSEFAYLSPLHLNLRQEILERLPIKKWTQIRRVAVEFYRRLFT